MNDQNVQIKGFTYQNGKYVKNPSSSDVQTANESGSTSREVNVKTAKKHKNSKKRK